LIHHDGWFVSDIGTRLGKHFADVVIRKPAGKYRSPVGFRISHSPFERAVSILIGECQSTPLVVLMRQVTQMFPQF